jgi:pantoate--beta-alanine ligase
MPEIAVTAASVREAVAAARAQGKRVGLVPTMGALHEGHLSLVRKAREHCDYIIVSIFVNPAQFGRNEDLAGYPRDLQKDAALCDGERVDLVFAPSVEEMYPDGFVTYVEPEKSLAGKLCGASRPGHFRGVDTVVLKLLNICNPDAAFFGQKDYQQSVIIRRMVADLNVDVEIVVCPTVREENGLAMSSRNAYLTVGQRKDATCLYRALTDAKHSVEQEKITNAGVVKSRMSDIISKVSGTRIDYIDVVDLETLNSLDLLRGKVVAVLAVFLGPARLIDNMILNAP